MSFKSILSSTIIYLSGLSKQKLVEVIAVLREKYNTLSEQYKKLEEEKKQCLKNGLGNYIKD